MASSYVWSDALTVAKLFVKQIPTSTIDVTVCDQLNSFIWRKYPWRWAQASLTSASGVLQLTNGTQDYALGTLTGAGFYQLLRARITRTDVTPNIAIEKDIVNWLAPNPQTYGAIEAIEAVAFEPVNSKIRLDKTASVSGSATYQIDGEYWFQPVKITSTGTTIVFPDAYFNVAIEGLKWKYYQLGDDPRAGGEDIQDGRTVYTGQYGVFMGELKKMVDQEDYGDAQTTRFPEQGLGNYRDSGPNLFGYY